MKMLVGAVLIVLILGTTLSHTEHKTVIKIGVILPHNDTHPFAVTKARPVLEQAIRRIEERGLLPGHVIQMRYGNSGPDTALSLHSVYDMYPGWRVHAFVGPIDDVSLGPVARQANIWKVPVITVGGVSSEFDDPKYYSTLVRLGRVNIRDLAKYLYGMFLVNDWPRVSVVYTPVGWGRDGMASFCHLLPEELNNTRDARTASGSDNIHMDYIAVTDNIRDVLQAVVVDDDESAVMVLCAPPDVVRDIVLMAEFATNRDISRYTFIGIDVFSCERDLRRPWYRSGSVDNVRARYAYRRVVIVGKSTIHQARNKASSSVSRHKRESPFPDQIDAWNGHMRELYDALIIYAETVNDTLTNGTITGDGLQLAQAMSHRTFSGITGSIRTDGFAKRYADYSFQKANISLVPGIYDPAFDETEVDSKVKAKKQVENPYLKYGVIIIIWFVLIAVGAALAVYLLRGYKLDMDLTALPWRLRWDDVFLDNELAFKASRRMSSMSGMSEESFLRSAQSKQKFTETGYLHGKTVSIKFINKTDLEINRDALIEVKAITDLNCDHICRFMGACLDPPNQSVITEYCQKGSLQDLLENDNIQLDWMFRFSLVQDISKGMAYLHASQIGSHGNLKSSNCVVDSRFVLKITDFGLHFLFDESGHKDDNEFAQYQRKLWTAPELLRIGQDTPRVGTQKGDVYSFAIIAQEVVYRNGVFYIESPEEEYSPREIIDRIIHETIPHFRPTLKLEDCSTEAFYTIICQCWSDDPLDRPEYNAIKTKLKRLNPTGDKGILENLLSRMEQYARNLEGLVEERTAGCIEEKRRAEELLYRMMPPSVAKKLVTGEKIQAESFDSVTIYFSDIVGFTDMAATCTPIDIIDLLNDLYTIFDSIIDNYEVYKVETIGDAYMVASGLPLRNGIKHAGHVARMALELLSAGKAFRIRFRPDDPLNLRIGIHSGPVCTGVVGLKMPRYCLFGDTVNTASRMESNGLPHKIHISGSTKELLEKLGHFEISCRGLVEMKGKGKVTTYWLDGEGAEHSSGATESLMGLGLMEV